MPVSLRLPRALETLDGVVQQIERGLITPIEAIDTLLAEEITVRRADASRPPCRWPGSPPSGRWAASTSRSQPSLDRNRIMALAGLASIDRHEVVHLIGQSGTGRTHLPSALEVEVIRAGAASATSRSPTSSTASLRPTASTPARAHPLSLPRPPASPLWLVPLPPCLSPSLFLFRDRDGRLLATEALAERVAGAGVTDMAFQDLVSEAALHDLVFRPGPSTHAQASGAR